MAISNDLKQLIEKVRYEVQYIDYQEGQFTVPVILTHDRANKIISDNSIKKVRFTEILGSKSTFTIEHKHLVYEV